MMEEWSDRKWLMESLFHNNKILFNLATEFLFFPLKMRK